MNEIQSDRNVYVTVDLTAVFQPNTDTINDMPMVVNGFKNDLDKISKATCI